MFPNPILVEIGTLTGYTSLTLALALPSDGQIITCDITDQYVRQDIWKKAGVQDKITLKVGPAVDTLKKLLEENGPGSFDFVFIDADKPNYMNYYQLAVELVRSNGLIVIDNTLWRGSVIDESDTSEEAVAIRKINDFVRDDQRVDISFLRIGDGTTLCRKK
jgi:O-methyltransferase